MGRMGLVIKITGKKKPLSSFVAEATSPKGGVLLMILSPEDSLCQSNNGRMGTL